MISKFWISIIFALISISAFAEQGTRFTLPSPVVDVTAVTPYDLGSSNTVYYLSATGVPYDQVSGYINIDPTDSTGSLIYFDIDATDLDSSSTYAVGLVASGIPTPQLIPIYSINGSVCTGTNCTSSTVSSGVTYYTSAQITQGVSNRVAINLKQVCAVVSDTTAATVCKSGNLVNDVTTTARALALKAYVGVYTDFSGTTVPTATSTGFTATAFTIQLQGAAPTVGCPSDISTLYFPGDGEIIFHPNLLTGSNCTSCGTASDVSQYILAGSEGTAAITTPTVTGYSTPNIKTLFKIVDRASTDAENETLSGFQNSTSSEDHQYSMAVFAEDEAGALSNASCLMSGVRTSEVQGFVGKNRCFIATAAFSSLDAAPVSMLRVFRDTVLLNSKFGTAFVQLYYRYSPKVALWVLDHPITRIPALFFLIPVEMLAYLILHSVLLVALSSLGIGIMIFSLFKFRKNLGEA